MWKNAPTFVIHFLTFSRKCAHSDARRKLHRQVLHCISCKTTVAHLKKQIKSTPWPGTLWWFIIIGFGECTAFICCWWNDTETSAGNWSEKFQVKNDWGDTEMLRVKVWRKGGGVNGGDLSIFGNLAMRTDPSNCAPPPPPSPLSPILKQERNEKNNKNKTRIGHRACPVSTSRPKSNNANGLPYLCTVSWEEGLATYV